MKFSHASAYSFGRSSKCTLEKTDPLFTPGPGQYAPSINKKSNPQWRIGTAKRGGNRVNDNPGPGQYTMPYSFPNGPKYSMSTKAGAFDPAKFNCSPGPGAYQPQIRDGNPKYSMRIRPNSSKSEVTPGPGNYDIRTDKSLQVPSYKFGTEKKDGLDLAQAKYVPGPGNYEYKADAVNTSQPKFSFGKELRGDSKRPMTPGPGQYQYKEYIGKEAPKITMSMKLGREQNESRYVPGPGQYNSTNSNYYRPKSPSYKIGTAKREGLYKFMEGNPGPGQYGPNNCTNAVRPKTPSWVIGTGKRPPLNPVDPSVPGPGNYNIGGLLGKGPKYTIVGKNTYGNNWKNGVPGPGQYENNTMSNLRKNPAWKIGTGSRDDALKRVIREGVPGPGMYDYSSKNKIGGPKYGFGTQKRGSVQRSDTPGPGQYHIPCSIVDVNDYTREAGQFDPNYRYI